MIDMSSQIKVFHVEGEKLGSPSLDNTIDEEFHKFQGTCGSTNITRVANTVATNSDAGAIGIIFLWTEFANHFGVCDLILSVNRDVLVENHNKGVSFFNVLACNSISSTNSLSYPPKFIGI